MRVNLLQISMLFISNLLKIFEVSKPSYTGCPKTICPRNFSEAKADIASRHYYLVFCNYTPNCIFYNKTIAFVVTVIQTTVKNYIFSLISVRETFFLL